jgi:hypothetical protein
MLKKKVPAFGYAFRQFANPSGVGLENRDTAV